MICSRWAKTGVVAAAATAAVTEIIVRKGRKIFRGQAFDFIIAFFRKIARENFNSGLRAN
jgi:hypothetical protein